MTKKEAPSDDHGLAVQGRPAKAFQDPARHGVGKHALHVGAAERAHAGRHVREELHETPAVTYHGDRAETGILLGPDEELETPLRHLLHQPAQVAEVALRRSAA